MTATPSNQQADGSRAAYMNRAQRYVFELMPRQLTLIAGRRFGKTDGVAAPFLGRVWSNMPRGKSAIYALTLKQALTRTIPGTVAAIERMTGWTHGIHFFVGCKAPKAAGFPDPIVRPFNWEHCIHTYTGHVTHILSQDVKFSANSLTLDAALADEARSMKKKKIDEELVPAISGTPGQFADFPLKKSLWLLTDRPLLREEMWVTDRESLSTPDVERELAEEIQLYAYMLANDEAKWAIREQLKLINSLRTRCHLYKEYDTIENLDIVGEDYIADMKRILPARIFNISILNIRQKRQSDGFYEDYEPERHSYVVETADVVNNMRVEIRPTPHNRIRNGFETWDFKRLQEHNCLLDLDIEPKDPLCIAFDYNANINWVVTGQRRQVGGIDTLLVLSSLFVKSPRSLIDLCADWSAYYMPHKVRNNRINFYYNQTAKQKKYANDNRDEPFWETIKRELTTRGWAVNCIDMGVAMLHNEKFFMFKKAFTCYMDVRRGQQMYPFPRFNKENNEFLLAAIENTGKRDGYNGTEKDKSDEKKADAEDNPAELRTDGTDAFDDLFWGVHKFYREGPLVFPVMSIR